VHTWHWHLAWFRIWTKQRSKSTNSMGQHYLPQLLLSICLNFIQILVYSSLYSNVNRSLHHKDFKGFINHPKGRNEFKFTHNPRGNTLGTWREHIGNKGKMKKKSRHFECMLSLPIECMKLLFLELVHHHFLATANTTIINWGYLLCWTLKIMSPF
jgi:hypothetical protein